MPKSIPINYKEISVIISSFSVNIKSFKEVGMKKEANEVKKVLAKMKHIYKKCDLITTLIYQKRA